MNNILSKVILTYHSSKNLNGLFILPSYYKFYDFKLVFCKITFAMLESPCIRGSVRPQLTKVSCRPNLRCPETLMIRNYSSNGSTIQ